MKRIQRTITLEIVDVSNYPIIDKENRTITFCVGPNHHIYQSLHSDDYDGWKSNIIDGYLDEEVMNYLGEDDDFDNGRGYSFEDYRSCSEDCFSREIEESENLDLSTLDNFRVSLITLPIYPKDE